MNTLFAVVIIAAEILVAQNSISFAHNFARKPGRRLLSVLSYLAALFAVGDIVLSVLGVSDTQGLQVLLLVLSCGLLWRAREFDQIKDMAEAKTTEQLKLLSAARHSNGKVVAAALVHPLVLAGHMEDLALNVGVKMRGFFQPFPIFSPDLHSYGCLWKQYFLLSDACDYAVFKKGLLRFCGVRGVFKDVGWGISPLESAQQLSLFESATQKYREERRRQASFRRRLLDETTVEDLVTYGWVITDALEVDINELHQWLKPLGPSLVEGRLEIEGIEGDFVSFERCVVFVRQGKNILVALSKMAQTRLQGSMPPLRTGLAALPFYQERRVKHGKHFLYLSGSYGLPAITEAHYEFFVREL